MEQNNINFPRSYDYYAFISYSRKDEAWAKWLQKKMEQYKLPTILRKEENSLPKKIRPIFRDKTDLTGGQLGDALRRELDSSKKLIVICSPASARSEWVNKEVQRFINNGRITDIIPFIVRGTPNSGDENECFPPALKLSEEEQLLGVSVVELGKKDALLRVIAGLLGIKFDQLKRRHEQRRKRQNLIASAITLAFFLAVGFFGYNVWDYYVPHEAYYADYVLKWGVPEGITKLTKHEIAVRQNHYITTTERGLIRKLIFANSTGTPVPHEETERLDRPMIALFYYRDDGRIEYVEYLDNNGKVLVAQLYTTDLKACDFQTSGEDSSLKTLASSTTSMATGMFSLDFLGDAQSDIARYALEYDKNGYITKTVYMRDRRSPILDSDGIGGVSYVLDNLGRPVEINYLGINGNSSAISKQNIAGKRYKYDDSGNLIRAEYFGANGEPAFNSEGWKICEFDVDKNGNIIKKSFVNAAGELIRTNDGYSYAVLFYDDCGNRTEFKYFNADGSPVRHREYMQSVRNYYDEYGILCKQSFFDENNDPVLRMSGLYHTVEYELDERGNYLSAVYLGKENEPVIITEGYASFKAEYDERGNRTLLAVFDENGEPVQGKTGSAINRTEYDERNNRIKESWFGTDGNPIIIEDGYAICVLEYDERNNVIKRAYFGINGEPVLHKTGSSSVIYKYDDGGNCVSLELFGTDGKPELNYDGYSSIKSEYDSRGNLSSIAFYGINGEPVTSVYGFAAGALEYNERGNCIQQIFMDINGSPVISYEDCAVLRAEYDNRGNITRMVFLGAGFEPVISNQGYSSIVFHYDSRGYGTGMSFFGMHGEPVSAKEGYASMRLDLDERGNMIDLNYFDVKGNILTKKSICVLTVYPGTIAEEYGLLAGDYIIEYNGWVYFDNDPGDMYSYYMAFLMELISTYETENRILVYRLSEKRFIEFDFESLPEFEFEEEMWINDGDYAFIKEAYIDYKN